MSFEKAMQRPADFNNRPPEEQWDIDKSLGILDWDGIMSPKQKKEYYIRFYPKKKQNKKKRK